MKTHANGSQKQRRVPILRFEINDFQQQLSGRQKG